LQAAVGRWFRLFLAPPEVAAVPVIDGPPPPVSLTIGPGIIADLPIIIGIIYDWRTRGRPVLGAAPSGRAISRKRQKALASFICPGERHSGSNSSGLATTIAAHRAREVATLSRFGL
jgi:hypothetical protein